MRRSPAHTSIPLLWVYAPARPASRAPRKPALFLQGSSCAGLLSCTENIRLYQEHAVHLQVGSVWYRNIRSITVYLTNGKGSNSIHSWGVGRTLLGNDAQTGSWATIEGHASRTGCADVLFSSGNRS